MEYKIIRILNGMVSIASNDGTFFNIPIAELNFEPKVGDEVQCFKNGEKVIVLKKSASVRKMASNVPVENLSAEDENKGYSMTLRIIGIIILLLLAIFLVYICSGKSATVSRFVVENNSAVNNSNAVVKGMMKDFHDGKSYRRVRICSLLWIAKNLNDETVGSFWAQSALYVV